MISRNRIKTAMQLGTPDRVPVMCQLAIGHYFLHSGISPFDIWYTSEGFAQALLNLRARYSFDGILINLPGRDPDLRNHIDRIEQSGDEKIVYWKNGCHSVIPSDDLPHYHDSRRPQPLPSFDEIEPDQLYYIEPYDVTGVSYPYRWGFEETTRPFEAYFPEYHVNTINAILKAVGGEVSVHSEIFSPWTQMMELIGYQNGLMAIFDDPVKLKECLDRLAEGAIDLGNRQAACGVDAVLISSAFAGGGFISRKQYIEFVLPYEKKVIEGIKSGYAIPVYTHTCGKIGDRLDLMLETGTNGIDTLDPPPLGNVDLAEAKQILRGKAFIKGNIDPVHTLYKGSRESIRGDVIDRLSIGKEGGGYILSTACSVSPHTPPEHIMMLAELAEEFGRV
jgi:hypothetical protein